MPSPDDGICNDDFATWVLIKNSSEYTKYYQACTCIAIEGRNLHMKTRYAKEEKKLKIMVFIVLVSIWNPFALFVKKIKVNMERH